MDCLKKTSKTGTTHGLSLDELQKAVLEATEMADSMVGEESLNQSLTPNDFKDGSQSFEFPDKEESNELTTPDSGIRMSFQDSEDLQVSTCEKSTEISNVESGEVKISVESNESSKPSENVSDEFSQIIKTETEDQKSHRSLRRRSSISKPEMKINEKSMEIPNVDSSEIETKVKSNESSISKPSKNASGTESEDKKSHRSLRKSTLLNTKRSSLSSSVVKPEVIAKIKDESKEPSISKPSKQVSKEVSQKVKTEPEDQKSHSKRTLRKRSSISSSVVNPEVIAKIKSGNNSVKQNKRPSISTASTNSNGPTHHFLNPNNDDGFEDFEPPLMVVRPDAVKSEDFQSKIPQLDGNSTMPDNSTNTESGINDLLRISRENLLFQNFHMEHDETRTCLMRGHWTICAEITNFSLRIIFYTVWKKWTKIV